MDRYGPMRTLAWCMCQSQRMVQVQVWILKRIESILFNLGKCKKKKMTSTTKD